MSHIIFAYAVKINMHLRSWIDSAWIYSDCIYAK